MNIKRLDEEPIDYILTVHIQNLVNTYGEEYVRYFLEELFFAKDYLKKDVKDVSNG